MKLKSNIIANYTSQIYTSAIGILMVPIYIKYMGAEAYGLVGIFATIQAVFNLLDIGLASGLSRETTKFICGKTGAIEYKQLTRSLEIIFILIAIFGGGTLILKSWLIAEVWLNASALPLSEIVYCLQAISITVVVRWVGGLYKGIISGAENLVWISIFNAIISTLRFVIIVPVIIYYNSSASTFFTFQLMVSIVEVAPLVIKAYKIIPRDGILGGKNFILNGISSIKKILSFSITIAVTTTAWILATQTDKILLPKLISLEEYGYFTAVVLIASGVTILTTPISSAIMPHLARLFEEEKFLELEKVYKKTTRLTVAFILPFALLLIIYPAEVLWVWSTNQELVKSASTTLSYYSIGNLFLAISAFPYYLQYAKGNLKIHLIATFLFVLTTIPMLTIMVGKFGSAGAGISWMITNIIYFLLAPSIVHKSIMPGMHEKWLIYDIILSSIPVIIVAFMSSIFFNFDEDRITNMYQLLIILILLIIISYITNKVLEKK